MYNSSMQCTHICNASIRIGKNLFEKLVFKKVAYDNHITVKRLCLGFLRNFPHILLWTHGMYVCMYTHESDTLKRRIVIRCRRCMLHIYIHMC